MADTDTDRKSHLSGLTRKHHFLFLNKYLPRVFNVCVLFQFKSSKNSAVSLIYKMLGHFENNIFNRSYKKIKFNF